MDFPTTERGFLGTRDRRLLASHDGGRSWQPIGPRHRFVALEFVSPRNGYALTDVGTLLATRDGARSWRFVRAFPGGGAGGPFRATVRFIDARRGWVIPFDQRIYRTLDGGRSWTRLAFRCGFVLGGASPAGSTSGYALCGGQPATIDQMKGLYATRDGGDSWRLVARGCLRGDTRCRARADVPLTGHASGLVFRSPRDGLMLASRLGIYRTRDGGRHWRTTLFTDDAFFVDTVSWPARRQIYALLSQAGLLASDDGGKHWQQRYPAGPGRPEGPVSFSSPTDGIGAGKGGFFRNPGAILATADGGKTWTVRTVIRGVAVAQLVRVSQRVVWAVGTEWNRNGRGRLAILRTSNGGRSWRKLAAPRGVT
ncbi:MAG TPA: YCF48-related protein, partial [Gaiellaceae bacterium]|nr:YCF48-related protein [Gaiellaceae bacterium]